MSPILLHARDLAERLDVRYETVLTWARRGKIPHVRDGRGRLLFNLDSVIEAVPEVPRARPRCRSAGAGPVTHPLALANPGPADTPAPPAAAAEPPARSVPLAERLVWSISDVVALTGLSRATLDRIRASGRAGFPRPNIRIGRRPFWRPQTIRQWIER
jgi:excisionase family DNA binding protein